ncbi:hypothetical protein [Roseomonas indoligenes]|uniref:Uncharacterized protein n=1 Tax=Roseomonas indoligenes TaxID=2820811 RepID=A0A940N9A5_9PROT|nr:hypothetical protein [Pararoseomonas indoligenes]MBP0496402.1 hypothetical protein [Pararoseomonas indoligenes]
MVENPQTGLAGLDRRSAANAKDVAIAVHVPFSGAAGSIATKANIVAYTRGWLRDLGPLAPGARPVRFPGGSLVALNLVRFA